VCVGGGDGWDEKVRLRKKSEHGHHSPAHAPLLTGDPPRARVTQNG